MFGGPCSVDGTCIAWNRQPKWTALTKDVTELFNKISDINRNDCLAELPIAQNMLISRIHLHNEQMHM